MEVKEDVMSQKPTAMMIWSIILKELQDMLTIEGCTFNVYCVLANTAK